MDKVCGDREQDSFQATFQMGVSTLHTRCSGSGATLCPGHLRVNFHITNGGFLLSTWKHSEHQQGIFLCLVSEIVCVAQSRCPS